MKFIAPCGHEGIPVTPNYITCSLCDKMGVSTTKIVEPYDVLLKIRESRPTVTIDTTSVLQWKTYEMFHEDLLDRYRQFVGSAAVGLQPGGVFSFLAEMQAKLLFDLQEVCRASFPESFV